VLVGHTDGVGFVSFSPDGTKLVSASKDETVRVWDSITGESIYVLTGQSELVHEATFSPDGSSILSLGINGSLCIWDVKTGVKIINLSKPDYLVE